MTLFIYFLAFLINFTDLSLIDASMWIRCLVLPCKNRTRLWKKVVWIIISPTVWLQTDLFVSYIQNFLFCRCHLPPPVTTWLWGLWMQVRCKCTSLSVWSRVFVRQRGEISDWRRQFCHHQDVSRHSCLDLRLGPCDDFKMCLISLMRGTWAGCGTLCT